MTVWREPNDEPTRPRDLPASVGVVMAKHVSMSDMLLQHGRALEWLTSSVIFGFALTLALPGDTLGDSPSFAGFLTAGLNEQALIMPLTLVAVMRMSGLYINGAWRRSPILRMVGAVIGAAVFLALAILFTVPYATGVQSSLSTGPAVYFVLFVFDLIAAYRTGADVRASQRP